MSRISLMSKPKPKLPTRTSNTTVESKAVLKCKIERQSKKIISALEEVKQVQEGKKSPKSFDDFLDEL